MSRRRIIALTAGGLLALTGMNSQSPAAEIQVHLPREIRKERVRTLIRRMGPAGGAGRKIAGRRLAELLRSDEKLLMTMCRRELKNVADFDTRIELKRILRTVSARRISKTLDALDREVSFEFVEQPLDECCLYLSQEDGASLGWTNLRLDPKTPVTLRMKKASLSLAITWLSMLTSSKLVVEPHGEILFTRNEISADQLLLHTVYPFGGEVAREQMANVEETVTMLARRIPQTVTPESWGPGRGVIRRHGAVGLLVLQTPRVHAKLEELWKAAGADREIEKSTDRSRMIAEVKKHLDKLAAERAKENAMMRRASGIFAKAGAKSSLTAALGDHDWEIRREAVKRLGSYRIPVAVTLLFRAAGDREGPVRGAASEAIRGIHGAWALEPLAAVLQRGDKPARRLAAEALGNIRTSRGEEMLVGCLADSSWEVRAQAVRGLAKFRTPRAVERILSMAGDEDDRVRCAVREALEGIKASWAIAPLSAALKGEDPDVRFSAVCALGRIRDPRVEELMGEALRDEHCQVSEKAAATLVELKSLRSAKLLLTAAASGDRRVRRAAREALARLDEPWGIELRARAFAPWVAQLGDEAWAKRRAASRELARIGAAAVPALREAVGKSADLEIIARAEGLLFKLDPLFVVETQLRSGDPANRTRGAMALGNMGRLARPAVPALIKALEDGNDNVRIATIGALAAIEDPRATKPIMALSKDPNSQVRATVAWALRALQAARGVACQR